MKVLLEISEWTKHTAHPPCLALGRLPFYVPVLAPCPGEDPPDDSPPITPFSSFPRLEPLRLIEHGRAEIVMPRV